MRRLGISFLCLGFVSAGAALAQTVPFETVGTLSSDVVPIERDFDIPQSGAGEYRIRITDIGALLEVPGPAPLDSVHVLVTRGRTVVAQFDGTEDDPPSPEPPTPVDDLVFDATPGTYTVHIVGKPGPADGSGPISLVIENATSGTPVLTLGGSLSPPAAVRDDTRSYVAEFDIPGGDYEISLADFEFPEPLQESGVILVRSGGSAPAACLSVPAMTGCPQSTTLNLQAGHYVMVAAGGLPESGSDGGIFAVHMRALADGAVVHSRTVEIGNVERIGSPQLDAGGYTLSLKDLEFPAKLGAVEAIATQAAQITASATAGAPDVTFTVAADDTVHDVFAYGTRETADGAGSYTVVLRPGSGPSILSTIEAIGSSTGSVVAYTFAGDVVTAGSHRARLGDFQFPAALSSARLGVVQNGSLVGSTDAANPGPTLTLDLAALAAGPVTAIAVVRPATTSGTVQQSGGTFGIELAPTAGGTSVIDATQGTGGLIDVRSITFPQAGKFDLTLTDLDFPEAFGDLMAVVSRGAQKLGTVIVGSGGSEPEGGSATLLDFEASAGKYSITILARPAEPLNAATYALAFEAAPPGPTVTLNAGPTSVTSGTNTSLTWTSQNATSCIGSSNPSGAWSGSKAVSGTENSAAITAPTTFTLRCTGANGRASEASVSVSVSAPSSGGGGGGGAFGWLGLLGLAACRALAHASRSRS